jgi:Ca2+-transporting ATPase
VIRGEGLMLMFLTSVSLAVAAVPEALPAVATITLALGARKMVRVNALVRRLPAVETLGSVTFICSDKTGTLTQNIMQCERFFVDGNMKNEPQKDSEGACRWLLLSMGLSNDASSSGEKDVKGDPTEVALYVSARDAGFKREDLEKDWPRVAEIPFDSDRKMMTTFHSCPDGGYVSFTKGAAESILNASVSQMEGKKDIPIKPSKWKGAEEQMAEEGLRVLGFAMKRWKELPEKITHALVEKEMTLLGLTGLMDPPREEAYEAVSLCKSAGITPVMITGDHPATAFAIAKRLGIAEKKDQVLTGRELADLPLEDIERKVEDIRVYARVAPEQKVKIVTALQDREEFVAMTGDGVNDAPALKRADIGVSMGITGTDVTKEAADMILLDDNFATIVKAVKEGRRIFDNIRKFIKYTMTSNSGEIWTIFLAPFLGLPIPLLPIHILWINLVTDGLPGLALAPEPAEPDIMKRPPRPPRESIIARGLGIHMVWVGLLMGAVCIFLQAWAYNGKDLPWQTMVFTVLCLSQMGHALAIRSDIRSLFSQGLFSNLPLTGAVLLTLVLQMATIYVPFLNPVFKTQPLSPLELIICLAASSIVFWAVEAEKLIKRRRANQFSY